MQMTCWFYLPEEILNSVVVAELSVDTLFSSWRITSTGGLISSELGGEPSIVEAFSQKGISLDSARDREKSVIGAVSLRKVAVDSAGGWEISFDSDLLHADDVVIPVKI